MRLLNSQESTQIAGGFVAVDLSGDKLIVCLGERHDSLIVKMNNQNNVFYFN